MKKILLLLCCCFSFYARAQHLPAARATGSPWQAWFDYLAVMATNNARLHYGTIYNDSTVTEYDSSSAQYKAVHDHGAGFSLDVYSKVWDLYCVNINYIPGFIISPVQVYWVDSIYVAGRYRRQPFNNYTDTLFIEIVPTGGNATFLVQNGPDTAWAGKSSDSTLRYFSPVYDADNNRISDSVNVTPNVLRRFTILLNAAFYADSLPDGSHNRTYALPGSMAVAPGKGVVAYVHYKSGHTYAPGTPVDSVNAWQQLYYELNGPGSVPFQFAKERNAGLISTSASRYAPYFMPVPGHRMLVPTLYFDSAARNDWPYMAFYVHKEPVGIGTVEQEISDVHVFPNPATTAVTILVATKDNAPVTVSLIDMRGQTVAVQKGAGTRQQTVRFSTAQLPSGVYRYQVQTGSAQACGNIVVQH